MRVALGVEYDGGAFSGFQLQKQDATVQQVLESALARIADAPIRLSAAGRTDTGVHATGQVVAFDTPVARPERAWVRGVNSFTPDTVKVRWARTVPDDFHPRFDATARRYMYLFHEDAAPSPLLDRHALRSAPLDDAAMHRAARVLVGEQDFSAFRAAGCQASTPYRCVHHVQVRRFESIVLLDLRANAFLLHMVRNIAGSLWAIGLGHRPETWLGALLEGRDRRLAAPTAPACGLYLVEVSYPHVTLPCGQPPGLLRALGGLDRI